MIEIIEWRLCSIPRTGAIVYSLYTVVDKQAQRVYCLCIK